MCESIGYHGEVQFSLLSLREVDGGGRLPHVLAPSVHHNPAIVIVVKDGHTVLVLDRHIHGQQQNLQTVRYPNHQNISNTTTTLLVLAKITLMYKKCQAFSEACAPV